MIDLELSYSGETRKVRLDDGEHTVGRAGNNAVQISMARVSKQHAVIRVDGNRLFVRDLGSTNGTDVGDQPIGADEVEVQADASVRFAGAILRRVGVGERAAATTMTRLAGDHEVSAMIRYNQREGYSAAARDRIIALSSDLFELLASGQDSVQVLETACKLVAEFVSADRVVLLENQGVATSEIEARARWTRKRGDEDAPLQLSSTIVGKVLSERDSVLVANPLEDPGFGEQKSIMALNLRSAMAAPLFDNERVRGILYVDTADPLVQYTQADLEVLTATANAVAVKLRNLSFEKEMRVAAQIQRAMLPDTLEVPPGYALDAYQMMCLAVGGDLYQCLPRREGKVLLGLGDVSGKGTPAALAMSAATVLIGSLAEIGGELEEMGRHLHRQLFRAFNTERFMTLFLAELDGETGKLHYINAGHEPPLLLRRDGTMEALDSTGMPMAMIEDLILESASVTIEPGDLLAVFSDGITEATVDGSNFLGLDTIKNILIENQNAPLPDLRGKLVSEVESYLAGEPTSDDVTLMLLRRAGGA